jgi:type II secretory pathway pseudopilin PulG
MIEKIKKLARFKGENKLSEILAGNGGLTIVELIIALAISLIVVAAAGFILLTQSGVIRLNRSVSTEQQRLNTAFSTVRYSLRMAGFDYGQNFFNQSTSIPPVQILTTTTNPATYKVEIQESNGNLLPVSNTPTSEVLITYYAPSYLPYSSANANGVCTLQAVNAGGNPPGGAAEFNVLSQPSPQPQCNINYFFKGENILVSTPSGAIDGVCITNVQPAAGKIQTNPGKGNGVCSGNPNPIPPNNIAGGKFSVLMNSSTQQTIVQVLFYWIQPSPPYVFNASYPPYSEPGALYECNIQPNYNPNSLSNPSPPTLVCAPDTVIKLDSYITGFSITPLNAVNPSTHQNYLYRLSIAGESDVAISDSPAYSVHTAPNAGAGTNILKTLNSNVFLRNVYYGD